MVSTNADALTDVGGSEKEEQGSEGMEGMNVGELERVVSAIVGSLLMVNGIRRMSLLGAGLAFVGYHLIKRGATGECALYKALDVDTREGSAGPLQESGEKKEKGGHSDAGHGG